MDAVGKRIREARQAMGMTQAELAKRLGVTYQNIGQWENGKRIPRVETLMKIGQALNVSWIWFTRPELFDNVLKAAQNEYRGSVSQHNAHEAFYAVLEGAYGKATEHIVTGKYCNERYLVYDNSGEPFALMEDDISIISEAVYSVMDTLTHRFALTEQEAEEQAQNNHKQYDWLMAAELEKSTANK